MIDHADQSEFLRHRHHVRREQELAVLLTHAHQALVERRFARACIDHRFEGGEDATLVQRGDDLVGDTDVDPALRVALDIGPPHRERTAAAAFRGLENFLGTVDRFIGVTRVTRGTDRADRGGDRDRAGSGRHDVIANARQKPLGGDIHVIDRAVLQDQSELVAGETAEHIPAAQSRADTLRDVADHLVGDIEAESVVDAREVIDPDKHEGKGGPVARGFLDRLGERRG